MKMIFATLVALIGICSALMLPFVWIAQSMSDEPEGEEGKTVGLVLFALVLGSVLVLLALSGCADFRALGHACKDGLCR